LLNICPVCGSTIEWVLVQNNGACFYPEYQPLDCEPLIQKLAVAGFAPVIKGSLSRWFIYKHQSPEAPYPRISIAQVFYGSRKFAGKNINERSY